jgi:hypothetical protein
MNKPMVIVYETQWMKVRKADPLKKEAFSRDLENVEDDIRDGYDLESVTECKGEIFFFLINNREIIESRRA